MTAVHCDYFRDLRDILATRLSADGFQVEAQDDHDTLLVRFLNVAQRMIPTQARRVKWSSELRGREPSLDPTVRKVLAEIERASAAGEDLNRYLSRQLVRYKNADFNDALFNEWDIKHMHLGDGLEAPGIVKDANTLLFVIHTEDVLHFIEVRDHPKRSGPTRLEWANQELFRIAQSNWPELSDQGRCPGVSAGSEGDGFVYGPSTPEQRMRARRANINVGTVGATGNVYVPIGRGSMLDGTNYEVREEADRILNRVHRLEEAHKTQGSEIAAKIALKTGAPILGELRLKLLCVNREDLEVIVTETQTRQKVLSSSS